MDPTIVDLLAAIIRRAEEDADLVAALLKSLDVAPSKQAREFDAPVNPQVGQFLLGLAAAIRLRSWENAGLISHLPSSLPNSAQALARAADADPSNDLPQRVWQTWLTRFARNEQGRLPADIFLRATSVPRQN